MRFLSNYSTGLMGARLAQEALRRGHRVTLVSGPTELEPPPKAKTIRVESAQQMQQALRRQMPRTDVLIMAAAVSDFRPTKTVSKKLARRGRLSLTLEATPDIVANLPRRRSQLVVGFAVEASRVRERAARKLREKRLDLIVGQRLSTTKRGVLHNASADARQSRVAGGSAAHGGGGRIGTTGRGIGPCYVDKVARCGIRIADLYDETVFEQKLRQNVEEKNRLLQTIYRETPLDFLTLREAYQRYAGLLKPFVTNTVRFLHEAIVHHKRLLFEGAQGTLLDIDHGTYPYVTSSNATAGGACVGAGVPPTCIDRVIGVVKAYTTRVGEGPLPTEFPPTLMQQIRTKGNEFGATTGRPRRCGWFDAVIARHAVQVNGCDAIVVTKLDVLDEMPTIQLCTAYEIDGKRTEEFPSNIASLDRVTPIYESMPGWQSDTTQAERFEELPRAAHVYLHRLETLLGVKICLISIGSRREQAFKVGCW